MILSQVGDRAQDLSAWPVRTSKTAHKKGVKVTKIIIEGESKEIAALVLAVQGRQGDEEVNIQNLSDSIRGILLEFAEKS